MRKYHHTQEYLIIFLTYLQQSFEFWNKISHIDGMTVPYYSHHPLVPANHHTPNRITPRFQQCFFSNNMLPLLNVFLISFSACIELRLQLRVIQHSSRITCCLLVSAAGVYGRLSRLKLQILCRVIGILIVRWGGTIKCYGIRVKFSHFLFELGLKLLVSNITKVYLFSHKFIEFLISGDYDPALLRLLVRWKSSSVLQIPILLLLLLLKITRSVTWLEWFSVNSSSSPSHDRYLWRICGNSPSRGISRTRSIIVVEGSSCSIWSVKIIDR